jgi:hypothetical protein
VRIETAPPSETVVVIDQTSDEMLAPASQVVMSLSPEELHEHAKKKKKSKKKKRGR